MQTNDPLYELIRAITTENSTPARTAAGATAAGTAVDTGRSASQLSQIEGLFQNQIETIAENTRVVADNTNTRAQTSGGESTGATVAKTMASIVTGGFALNPIVSGLMQLFGGGSSDTPPPLEKFSLPAPLRVEAGISSSMPGLGPVDYGQNGMPRLVSPAAASVNVQVNAMDARSFLDRSEDIANAVRRAMLESSALNDVVSEL